MPTAGRYFRRMAGRSCSCGTPAGVRSTTGASTWMRPGNQQVSDERLCDLNTTALGYDWSPDGKDIVLVGSGPDGPFVQLLIYKVARTTTAASYFQNRLLVGRGAAPGISVIDIQPSWRP